MDTAVVDEQITEQLLRRLEETRFPHWALMNRIEGRIRTKDQLERYLRMLIHKLEESEFRHEPLMDRIDQLVMAHERLTRYEQSGAANAGAYWDVLSRRSGAASDGN